MHFFQFLPQDFADRAIIANNNQDYALFLTLNEVSDFFRTIYINPMNHLSYHFLSMRSSSCTIPSFSASIRQTQIDHFNSDKSYLNHIAFQELAFSHY